MMPRKKRSYERGGCYHITHRCHGRQYLFRFAKYRDFYVRRLFQGVWRYGLDVLDYIVTSKHVHLLVYAHDGPEISETMRYVHGRIGQWHNGQRGRTGAFWVDRYHPTQIQSGSGTKRRSMIGTGRQSSSNCNPTGWSVKDTGARRWRSVIRSGWLRMWRGKN